MQKKDDKVNNKTAYKKEMQREKKESEKKNRNIFAKKSPHFGLRACPKKTKKLLN